MTKTKQRKPGPWSSNYWYQGYWNARSDVDHKVIDCVSCGKAHVVERTNPDTQLCELCIPGLLEASNKVKV